MGKHYTLEHFANSKIPSLLVGARMPPQGPLKKFDSRIAKGKSEKPYPREIRDPVPDSNWKTLYPGANCKLEHTIPSGRGKNVDPQIAKGKSEKNIHQVDSGDPVPDSSGKTLYPGALCKLENTIPFGRKSECGYLWG
jgi:hypothetical protein